MRAINRYAKFISLLFYVLILHPRTFQDRAHIVVSLSFLLYAGFTRNSKDVHTTQVAVARFDFGIVKFCSMANFSWFINIIANENVGKRLLYFNCYA